jgi:cyclophilin family peptidyl-prolyl cis-trans isomerase
MSSKDPITPISGQLSTGVGNSQEDCGLHMILSQPNLPQFRTLTPLVRGVLLLGCLLFGFGFFANQFFRSENQSAENVSIAAIEKQPTTQSTTPHFSTATSISDVKKPAITDNPIKPDPEIANTPAGTTRLADERLLLRTIGGDIVLALFPDAAPETVGQFLKWAETGVFDTTHFFRAEKNFVLQTSLAQDRLIRMSPDQSRSLRMLPGEFSQTLKHRKGVISMGREDDKPNSAQTSYSILVGDAPHLDGKYTIFGFVESGMDVVERLMNFPVQSGTNRPESRLTILHVRPVKKSELVRLQLEKPVDLKHIQNQIFPSNALALTATSLLKTHCGECHNEVLKEGGLDLTTSAGFKLGGKHGPIFWSDKTLQSPLLVRVTTNGDERMPPRGEKLQEQEISLLTSWLTKQQGTFPNEKPSEVPVSPKASTRSPDHSSHWFFQPLRQASPPEVNHSAGMRNEIDAFIWSALKSKNLKPVPHAADATVKKRVSYGLTGLPWVAGTAESYEQLVERLLNSPSHGEHLARQWLDLARFAESDGYENDGNRPHAYAYRDFVIRAFNDDMPFDQFLKWQIAGDELNDDQPDARAATGFLAAGPFQTFFPKKKDRFDELDDIVSTTSSVFLGLTTGCARCHDHKHDPISREDYYRMVSVFNGSNRTVAYLDTEQAKEYEAKREPLNQVIETFNRFKEPIHLAAKNRKIDQLPIDQTDKDILRLPPDNSNARQLNLLHRYEHLIKVSQEDLVKQCSPMELPKWNEFTSQIADLEKKLGPPPQQGLIYTGTRIVPTPVLERGNPDRGIKFVEPGFLSGVTKSNSTNAPNSYSDWGKTPRIALGNWLTDVQDGVGGQVARVIVNRIWQNHFGVGLVSTPNDFGLLGARPSHPELLDWLAQELIRSGWKLKHLHRKIVTSATYRLQSIASKELQANDPENRLLGHFRIRRLKAEELRDSILAVCGNLNREQFGPSIKPPIPADSIFPTAEKHGEVWPSWAIDGPENWRRSIYVFNKRSNPVPFFQLFDTPDAAVSCATRQQTETPTQSLALMNDRTIRHQAQLLAKQITLTEIVENDRASVNRVFQTILGREPTDEERNRSSEFLATTGQRIPTNGKWESLTDLIHALLMSNEFLFVE